MVKKKKRKKVLEYNGTLKNAIDDAITKRTICMQEYFKKFGIVESASGSYSLSYI